MLFKAVPVLFLLFLAQLPSSSQNSLDRLSDLETGISTSWRNNDRQTFQANVSSAMEREIPKLLLEVTSSVSSILADAFARMPGKLKLLSYVFTISSVVTDVLGKVLFNEADQFAELYSYLEKRFIELNAMIEANFHAIKDLESVVQCGQVSRELMSRQTLVRGFFSRYKEMLERAKTGREEALKIFDTELPQLQSSRVLLELQQMLTDKTVFARLLTYCARGDLILYLKMMVELHHTFQQAIILDTAAKIRLFGLTKENLTTDRQAWREKSMLVVNRMADVGNDLVMKSWYNFYRTDIEKSIGTSADQRPSDAAGLLNSVLNQKYIYVRTAVIIVPKDSKSIDITDAFGHDMRIVSADSFVCHRSRRASGETVIVLCRNVFVYPKEQADLDSAYATYTRGVLSLSLVDALRNDRWDDIGSVMNTYQVSFFAVKVLVRLNSGSAVSTAQSNMASNLAFFQSEGTGFQALVIAKLAARGGGGRVVPPTKVTSAGSTVAAYLPVVVALASVIIIQMTLINGNAAM